MNKCLSCENVYNCDAYENCAHNTEANKAEVKKIIHEANDKAREEFLFSCPDEGGFDLYK